jgi:hypothetical protein
MRASFERVGRAVDRAFGSATRAYAKLVTAFVLTIPGLALYALAGFVTTRSSRYQVPVFVFMGLVVILSFILIGTDEQRRRLFERLEGIVETAQKMVKVKRELRGNLGVAAPIFVAVTYFVVSIGFFSSLTFVLHEHGSIDLIATRGTELFSGNVADFYLWHFLDAIPLLRVTETLRWSVPITYEAVQVGMLLLAFKLFVIIPTIGIFRTHREYQKDRKLSPAPSRSP